MCVFINFPEQDASVCAFSYEKVVQSDIQEQLDILKNIKWQKFTDNFLWVFTGDVSTTRDFDWFDDSQWSIIIDNTKLLSKIVNEAGFKGIFFDTENYYYPQNIHPWCITEKYAGKDYKTIGKKVRQRGKEFITALQNEKSDIKVFTTFIYSYLAKDSTDTYSPLAKFFFDGMLEGINKDAQIIDGLESHYWACKTYEFPWTTNYSKKTVLENNFVAKDVEHVYKSNVTTSAGLFCNHILGIDAGQEGYGNNKLDTETKLEWLEHNVYNAMLNNDEYVWLYNQGDINWWKDFNLKSEAIETINSAVAKIKNHNALGYTLDNSDQSKINEIGFYITKSDTILELNTNDLKREYHIGDSIRLSIKSNDVWANYVRFYINGQVISQIPFSPFYYNLDSLKEGVYDLYATGYTQSNKLIQSNFITIEVKPKRTFYIENYTKELISCAGTENNYIECNTYSNYGQELHYEWYKNYSRLEGENNSSKLVFSKFDSNSTGIYQCKVYISGESEVWSGDIPVYALSIPEIIDQPKDIVDAIIGNTYKFEVKVKSYGKLPPDYKDSIQWYKFTAKTKETTPLKDKDRYSGTNTSQLVITELTKSDICEKGDYYFAEIKSRCGKVISNHFTITKISEIVILNNPKDTSICEGNVIEMKIDYNAKNCDSLSFQWFFDDKPITKDDDIEFKNANLKLSNTNKNYSGKYFLEI